MNIRHPARYGRSGAAHAGHAFGRQGGVTLVELMISIVLGLLVVLAAIALLVSTKTGYTQQDAGTRVEETGRYALEILARALHQAAYEDWDGDGWPLVAGEAFSANIMGVDASDIQKSTPGIDVSPTAPVNGSDVLAVRYFGVGDGEHGDGSVLNCAGFGVAAPASQDTAEEDRGWSIFHVTVSSTTGEPELRCKYLGQTSWQSDAIVAGVESFQVLYGVDTDGDSMPNTYLNATGIDTLDASLELEGASVEELEDDRNRKTYWKKIAVVKIGLLVRESTSVAESESLTRYDLFGENYGDAQGTSDTGTRIEKKDLSAATRSRLRKVFTQTIQLRNRSAGGGA